MKSYWSTLFAFALLSLTLLAAPARADEPADTH